MGAATGRRAGLAGQPVDHDPVRRAALLAGDDVNLALVAPSGPLGIEALPADEAAPLLAAYNNGVAELPDGLRAWAAPGLAAPDASDLAARLDAGLVGLCLPAGVLAGPGSVARIAPLLAVLEGRSAALFVHPGPAPLGPAAHGGAAERPMWWPALTDYVSQMHAAWLGFREWVRPARPGLRVCFAMLAGLAPLHRERLASRGADAVARDPLAFYDTSSYGPGAIAAMAAVVGAEAIVHGSDRPVVTPPPPAARPTRPDPVRTANPARLLAL